MEGEPYIVEPALSTPLHDEFSYLNPSDGGSGSLCSPLDGPPSASYQLYNPEAIHSEASGSGTNHWGDYNKGVDSIALDHYTYEVTNNNPVISYPDVDFAAPYETFAYHNTVESGPWS